MAAHAVGVARRDGTQRLRHAAPVSRSPSSGEVARRTRGRTVGRIASRAVSFTLRVARRAFERDANDSPDVAIFRLLSSTRRQRQFPALSRNVSNWLMA